MPMNILAIIARKPSRDDNKKVFHQRWINPHRQPPMADEQNINSLVDLVMAPALSYYYAYSSACQNMATSFKILIQNQIHSEFYNIDIKLLILN
jgi:hypothetical protein